jgi:hypothetical protein
LVNKNKNYYFFTCSFKDFPVSVHFAEFSFTSFADPPILKAPIERPPEPPSSDLPFSEALLKFSLSKRRYSLPLSLSTLMTEPISLKILSEI